MNVAKSKPGNLGCKQARELEQAPSKIESLETEQSGLLERLSEPGFYKRSVAEQARIHERMTALKGELEAAYARWSELENLQDGR